MTPSLARPSAENGRLANGEPFGQFSLRKSASRTPNEPNIGVRQFSLPLSLAMCQETGDAGVMSVLGARNPLQILQAMVAFVTVLVVDLVKRCRRRADEGFGKQAVDTMPSSISVAAEVHTRIEQASMVGGLFLENVPDLGSLSRFGSAYSAKVADFVPALIADDGTPFFGGAILNLHRKITLSVSRSRTALTVAAASIITQIGGA